VNRCERERREERGGRREEGGGRREEGGERGGREEGIHIRGLLVTIERKKRYR